MIYFLDNSLQLQKIVTSKNVISAIHEHELNGLIRGDVELDLSYANKFLILGIDHVGYYYKDEFYLHKIQRVEYDHVNESVKVVLRHIFFEDMIFGKLIQDVRPQNQDALTVSRQTIDANTRWQTIMTDVTGRLSTNFYWQVPYEVIEFMTENYRIEYLPKILFDGQKINGFQLHLAKNIGEDKNIRIPYGSRVLDLKYEEDYSEIITKLVVHGKGEEVGDGYGRRINISDVNFSRNGVESPVGSLYLEDETITNTYGNDGQTPREGREVFEDIEDANELAEAGYQHYLQVSRPQMLFTADVADIGDVGIGDSVMIIRREYDVYFNARIHKLSVDLLYPEDAQVELGDYKHFKESKIARKSREKNNRVQGQLSDRITRLKKEANDFIDGEFSRALSEFEQNLIDQKALIEADRENMTNLIEGTRTEWTEAFDASVAEAHRLREENYNAMSEYVNTTVDTTRSDLETSIASNIAETERKAQLEHDAIEQRVTDTVDTTRGDLESSINASIDDAKDYAEQQAQEKAEAVRTELGTVTNGHQQMLDDLEVDVMNIDDFLGNVRDITLDERLQRMNLDFIEEISNINLNTANMLQGTNFDEPDKVRLYGNTDLLDRGDYNVVRVGRPGGNEGLNTSSFRMNEPVYLEANKDYFLYIEYRSFSTPELDYLTLSTESGVFELYDADKRVEGFTDLTTDGSWRRAKIRINLNNDHEGQIRIGSRWNRGAAGVWIETRRPYMTDTNNDRWLPHPMDATQSIEQISRRITELEDGRLELITRTEYDFATGELDQYIKSVESTVEGNYQVLQRVENWQATNGASIEETIYGFDQRVWLNDVANIGANLIPQSANAWEDGGLFIEGGGESGSTQHLRTKERIKVQPNTTYTLSSNSTYTSNIERVDIHQYLHTGGWINRRAIPRDGEVTFTTWGTADSVRIALIARDGFGIPVSFIEQPDGRVKIKLEAGSSATPMLNAISRIEQIADKINMTVIEMDGEYLRQSDIEIKPGYVQLGSQRLGDSQLASIFRVSPNSIQAITDHMILNGDLYVDGDITALAVNAARGDIAFLKTNILTADSVNATHIESESIGANQIRANSVLIEKLFANSFAADHISTTALEAVEGEFASLFAAQLNATTITAEHIGSKSITVDEILIDDALVETIVARRVFTDDITSKIGNFIDLNAGNIVTAGLSANVIKADHIQVGTQLVDELFATSARIDELITKSHFVNEMHALTLNVVDLNASEIRARLLTANTIEAEWLKVGTTLIDRLFATTAMFERMMAKSGFVTTLNTVTIDTDQLTVRRPDGVAWVSNGMARFDTPVQVQEYMDTSVEWTGQRYMTNARATQKCAILYTSHAGRYLRIGLTTGMRYNAQHASTRMGIVIRPENSPSGTNWQPMIESKIVYRSENDYAIYEIDLGKPTFGAASFSLEFYRIGDNVENPVTLRIHRAWITG